MASRVAAKARSALCFQKAPIAALSRRVGVPTMAPASLPASRYFAISSGNVAGMSGVPFGDLLVVLDAEYGLASRFIQEPLSELAQILGYVKLAADTVIEFSDAEILMEEIGVPPIPQERLDILTIAPETLPVDELVSDVGDDDRESGKLPSEAVDDTVTVSRNARKNRLFRR